MKSLKDRRVDDIVNKGDRTVWPCMRCLHRYAQGQLKINGLYGCYIPIISDRNDNEMLWDSFNAENEAGDVVQFVRCSLCLDVGQDCFAVSTFGANWRTLARIGPN
jgi:hypothetical protein